MMKKMMILLFVLFVMFGSFGIKNILFAKEHCDKAYLVCLDEADNNKSALDDCLRGWAACEGIPLK